MPLEGHVKTASDLNDKNRSWSSNEMWENVWMLGISSLGLFFRSDA
jgi:hypothetical protein